MVYSWKSLIFGDSESFEDKFPLHYHLLKNDISGVIEQFKGGADPLKKDEKGEDAIYLALKFFIKYFNKCLMTPVSLGFSNKNSEFSSNLNSNGRYGSFKSTLTKYNSLNSTLNDSVHLKWYKVCDIGRLSTAENGEYERLETQRCVEYYVRFQEVSWCVSRFFDNPRDEEMILAVHARLLKKTRGFLTVLKVICENNDYRSVARKYLEENISMVGYPLLYVGIMDHLFSMFPYDSYGRKLNKKDVNDCKRLYTYATRSKLSGIYIMKFVTQICDLLQQLFLLLNHPIDSINREYSSDVSVQKFEYKQRIVQLDGLSLNIMELYANLAFVTDLPILFNVMLLQPKFDLENTQFNWNHLLNTITKRRNKLGSKTELLARNHFLIPMRYN
ncbi:hypothetical protein TpMuguga_01g00249 [Theileria parva strain Muguga]|uniref:Uncharacterized protein n=1 Tax=Theileria parva TaxID=5875 RepID=Q4N965_THEPA|nr:uncharacterized protein TpMuguga_01g00249 [Theileria parva strain Muguga]EAN33493.1 hypothetical protein TpMuguga_01g00249 [Theileria parva strain Muguga]|eukprot:XP_765776.1 hypothetical protein [Theileria parva strain Muguga]